MYSAKRSDGSFQAVCTPCSAGRYSDDLVTSANTVAEACPKYCPLGTRGVTNATKAFCQACEAGTMNAAMGATVCSACPDGTYSVARSSSCTSCPSGTYSQAVALKASPPLNSVCTNCSSGTFSATGATACQSNFWKPGSWGSCSNACGGGTQTRSLECWGVVAATTAQPVLRTPADCAGAPLPATSQSCNSYECLSDAPLNLNAHNLGAGCVALSWSPPSSWYSYSWVQGFFRAAPSLSVRYSINVTDAASGHSTWFAISNSTYFRFCLSSKSIEGASLPGFYGTNLRFAVTGFIPFLQDDEPLHDGCRLYVHVLFVQWDDVAGLCRGQRTVRNCFLPTHDGQERSAPVRARVSKRAEHF